jgi:hypothetical protein
MVFRFHSLLSDESTVVIAPDSCRFPPPWSVEEQCAGFTVRTRADRRSVISITRKSPGGKRQPSRSQKKKRG